MTYLGSAADGSVIVENKNNNKKKKKDKSRTKDSLMQGNVSRRNGSHKKRSSEIVQLISAKVSQLKAEEDEEEFSVQQDETTGINGSISPKFKEDGVDSSSLSPPTSSSSSLSSGNGNRLSPESPRSPRIPPTPRKRVPKFLATYMPPPTAGRYQLTVKCKGEMLAQCPIEVTICEGTTTVIALLISSKNLALWHS